MDKAEIEQVIKDSLEYLMQRNWKLLSLASAGLPACKRDIEKLAKECAEYLIKLK